MGAGVLTRIVALAVLAAQPQPLYVALLCGDRPVAAESCESMNDRGGPGPALADAAPAHESMDCALMGPCAARSQWTALHMARFDMVPVARATALTNSAGLPDSFDAAPVTPPPQA